MTERRLIEQWAPPQGFRLASVVATTYELHADLLEEDVLPVALGLRLSPGRGRDFRLELERALQDVEVSVFFHPERYQPGLRRSPRVDLLPFPRGHGHSKLHAKVALLRFVSPTAPKAERQIVRLIVGSANLTAPGYRSNIEVAASIDDAPGARDEASTAVRDAVDWLERLVGRPTEQVSQQIRDMQAVFDSRPVPRRTTHLRFVGLPSSEGFPQLVEDGERAVEVTLVSPFWPTGSDLSDVARALQELCGGTWQSVRLIGPHAVDAHEVVRPVIPARLVGALLATGARVEVGAADPGYGCSSRGEPDTSDEDEFDDVAARRAASLEGTRALHAKALLVRGSKTTRLAMGSFNVTRRGLGLVRGGNVEAGLLWALPNRRASSLGRAVSFGTAWREVTRAPEDFVVEPRLIDEREGEEHAWPAFIVALRARRDVLIVKGDRALWPAEVCIRMRDIRARALGREEWFDDWIVRAPTGDEDVFRVSTPLRASWWDSSLLADAEPQFALPELEAEISWDGGTATVPVVFEEKHRFPVVELSSREDERALIAWFLGLRPHDDPEDGGFGHSIDPVRRRDDVRGPTDEILSYLVRDFVDALPGIRSRLADAGMTATGLRTALLGHRSPVELAREVVRAHRSPQPGKPRKTIVATAFQLAELRRLLASVPLPELAGGVAEALRAEAVAEVSTALSEVIAGLRPQDGTEIIHAYLDLPGGQP